MLPDDYVVPLPPNKTLLPHQEANVRFAAGRKVTLIADPPGLGKTFSAIALINCFLPKRVLIICPASLKINWVREWEKYSIHTDKTVGVSKPAVPPGAKRKDGSRKPGIPASLPNTDVVVINYDVIEEHHAKLTAVTWDFVIIDEAHYVKNPEAKRTKLLFGKKAKRKPIQGIPYKRMILLTGTPMTNRPVDLWVFCEIGDPFGLGKDYYSFVKRYCGAWNSPWGLDVSGASNLEDLGNKLRASFMIRHDKGLLNLPPKIPSVVELPSDGLGVETLIKREAELFAKLNADHSLEHEDFDEQVAKLDAQKASDRVQMMTDLAATRQEVALKKLPLCLQFVDNLLDQGEKVVLFVYHRVVAKALMDRYGDKAVSITGTTPEKARQKAVDAFQDDPAVRVFIGQIKAAGTGLTLTAARIVAFIEIDYVPANLEQAEDRVYRIGQDRLVNAYYLVLQGSLDATIMDRVVEKRGNIKTVMQN